MLSQGKIVIIICFMTILFSCRKQDNGQLYYTTSVKVVGPLEYSRVYSLLADSFKKWVDIRSEIVASEIKYPYNIDSLMCFNRDGNRFIACRYLYINIPNSNSDDVQVIYGEKINEVWYFLRGESIVAPRKITKENDFELPFSYLQAHGFALNQVFSRYLNNSFEINEEWFKEHFEGSGWGDFDRQEEMDWVLHGKRFTNRKEYYEFMHLRAALGVWSDRDTNSTKPVQPIP